MQDRVGANILVYRTSPLQRVAASSHYVHNRYAAGGDGSRAPIGHVERARAAGGGVFCRLSPGEELDAIVVNGVAASVGRDTRINARLSASARGLAIVRGTTTADDERRDCRRVPFVLCHNLSHCKSVERTSVMIPHNQG